MDNKKIVNQNILLELKSKANVILVGNGVKYTGGRDTGKTAIVVGVTEKKPLSELAGRDVIPTTIKGVDTDVYEVGAIKLRIDRTGKFRPVPGGVSMGHKDGPTGTGGCLVERDGMGAILSNNHVLAKTNEALTGDAILQPGYVDGGRVATSTIAWLYEFVRIEIDGISDCPIAWTVVNGFNFLARLFHRKTRLPSPAITSQNTVDAALALPVHDNVLDTILEDDGSHVGITGKAEPEIGLLVKKTGRTTGTTYGKIRLTDVSVTVDMGGGRTATFVDQFAIDNPFSEGGDSGSIILTEDNRAAGLLFAGSLHVTIANRWSNVTSALRLD